MALRNIVLENDEQLRKTSREVKNVNDHIRETLDDMVETMRHSDGVGLAAPQIGVMRRMFVAEPVRGEVYKMINPEITFKEGEQEFIEGCLSVPGFVGNVKRPEKIHIKALNENGEPQEFDFEGFHAVVMCHEYDHLDGILYTDIAEEIWQPTEEDYEDDEQLEEE